VRAHAHSARVTLRVFTRAHQTLSAQTTRGKTGTISRARARAISRDVSSRSTSVKRPADSDRAAFAATAKAI